MTLYFSLATLYCLPSYFHCPRADIAATFNGVQFISLALILPLRCIIKFVQPHHNVHICILMKDMNCAGSRVRRCESLRGKKDWEIRRAAVSRSDDVAALDNNPTRFQPVPHPGSDDKLSFFYAGNFLPPGHMTARFPRNPKPKVQSIRLLKPRDKSPLTRMQPRCGLN